MAAMFYGGHGKHGRHRGAACVRIVDLKVGVPTGSNGFQRWPQVTEQETLITDYQLMYLKNRYLITMLTTNTTSFVDKQH